MKQTKQQSDYTYISYLMSYVSSYPTLVQSYLINSNSRTFVNRRKHQAEYCLFSRN